MSMYSRFGRMAHQQSQQPHHHVSMQMMGPQDVTKRGSDTLYQFGDHSQVLLYLLFPWCCFSSSFCFIRCNQRSPIQTLLGEYEAPSRYMVSRKVARQLLPLAHGLRLRDSWTVLEDSLFCVARLLCCFSMTVHLRLR
jgi:hypothetical protein